jgi:hypothetical protein
MTYLRPRRAPDRRLADQPAVSRPPYDWPLARAWYEADGRALLQIAQRLGCSYRAVTRRKAREGWTRAGTEMVA